MAATIVDARKLPGGHDSDGAKLPEPLHAAVQQPLAVQLYTACKTNKPSFQFTHLNSSPALKQCFIPSYSVHESRAVLQRLLRDARLMCSASFYLNKRTIDDNVVKATTALNQKAVALTPVSHSCKSRGNMPYLSNDDGAW